MTQPLFAQALSVGGLFNTSLFALPRFQREYAWDSDEVEQFMDDLQAHIESPSYFLGLIILTATDDQEDERRQIVDGQQRLLTVTLLALALFDEAKHGGRDALADRIEADFLHAIDYDTDDVRPRLLLTDTRDKQHMDALRAAVQESVGGEDNNSKVRALHAAAGRN